VQLHQQKGMISLSPPTICNSAIIRTMALLNLTPEPHGQGVFRPIFSPFDITDLKLSLFVVLVGKKSLSILYSLDNLLAFSFCSLVNFSGDMLYIRSSDLPSVFCGSVAIVINF
jgi:hypothetical protein